MVTKMLFAALSFMALALPALAVEKASPAVIEATGKAGKARVMVMLEQPASRTPTTHRTLEKRVAATRDSTDRLLASLPRKGAKVLRRFSLVPAVVMEVDSAALRRLRDHPAVRRIDLDSGGSGAAIAPDAASVLNGVSGLQAAGVGGAGMKVAVIDTGVDTDHPDLQSRLVAQQCFCSNAGGTGGCCPNGQASQSGNGAAEDDNGHGTNVTGIIVGEGNVAPRGAVPLAQLVSVKVLDAQNRFCCTSDVVAAMDWVASQHPDVDAVNLSLGTDALYPGDCDASSAFTQALAVAVDALVANGAVVAVSAGNQGSSTSTAAPACLRKVVGVGATWDFNGGQVTYLGCTESGTTPMQPTCFSNRSPTTDLFAAGAFVTSAGYTGGTSTYGGTSMAAPMAAACSVALKQAAPLATVDQRIDAMKLSPKRITDPVSGRVYPFLDCRDAVRLLNPSLFRPIRVNGSQPRIPPRPTAAVPSAWRPVTVPDTTETTPAPHRPVRHHPGDGEGDARGGLLR